MTNTHKPFLSLSFSFSIIVALACACSAQTKEIKVKDLVGRYTYSMNAAGDSIFVHMDGTYEHAYFKNGRKLHNVIGKWRYDSAARYLFFDNFTDFIDEGPVDLQGTWGPEVAISKDGNEIRLIYSEENDIYYFKPFRSRN